jgi:medium-chain acyl-[acyl-carrier-protein] hydrolase
MVGSPWFPFGPHPEASIRLLCLPHAGAGASVYRTWGKGLLPDVTVCPIQPPGRERRCGQEPFASLDYQSPRLGRKEEPWLSLRP